MTVTTLPAVLVGASLLAAVVGWCGRTPMTLVYQHADAGRSWWRRCHALLADGV